MYVYIWFTAYEYELAGIYNLLAVCLHKMNCRNISAYFSNCTPVQGLFRVINIWTQTITCDLKSVANFKDSHLDPGDAQLFVANQNMRLKVTAIIGRIIGAHPHLQTHPQIHKHTLTDFKLAGS